MIFCLLLILVLLVIVMVCLVWILLFDLICLFNIVIFWLLVVNWFILLYEVILLRYWVFLFCDLLKWSILLDVSFVNWKLWFFKLGCKYFIIDFVLYWFVLYVVLSSVDMV